MTKMDNVDNVTQAGDNKDSTVKPALEATTDDTAVEVVAQELNLDFFYYRWVLFYFRF